MDTSTKTLSRRGLILLGALGVFALGVDVALAESTLDRIKSAKKIVVGTEAAYPPMEFVLDGKIVGMGEDILKEVATDLGVEVEQLDLPFQGILPGLIAGKFDLVATSVGINAERAKRYAYTLPVAENSATVLVKARGPVKDMADLDGRVVATQLASSMEPIARRMDENLKTDGKAGFKELKLYPAFNDCFLAVANGTADAAIASLPVVNTMMVSRPGLFQTIGRAVDQPSYVAWVVRPEDKDLRDAVNGTLLRLERSGRMAELQEKWLKTTYPLPTSNYLPEGAQ